MTNDELTKLKRRIRQRGYVKKAYDRQKQAMDALKAEVEALEEKYRTLVMQEMAASGNSSDEDGAVGDVSTFAASTPAKARLLEQYNAATALKNELCDENAALYEANALYMKVGGRLQQLLDMHEQPLFSEDMFYFRPLSDAEYFDVIRDSRDYVLRFLYGRNKISSGGNVFGWRDQRTLHDGKFNFAVEKVFVNRSAFELTDRTWSILTHRDTVTALLSPAVNVKVHQLQRINADTFLYYWIADAVTVPVTEKTIILLVRVQYELGYMIVFQSIDKDRIHFHDGGLDGIIEELKSSSPNQSKRQEHWGETRIWIVFQDDAPHTVFQFGGDYGNTHWFVEVLLIAMRWENLVVGQRLLLSSGASERPATLLA